jgi:hypothetical protein
MYFVSNRRNLCVCLFVCLNDAFPNITNLHLFHILQYLLHDKDGWEHIQKFLDWTIFIEADVDVCIDRLKERNKCIPGYTPEQIEVRCEEVDRVNAELASLTAGKYASMVVQTGAILPTQETCEV